MTTTLPAPAVLARLTDDQIADVYGHDRTSDAMRGALIAEMDRRDKARDRAREAQRKANERRNERRMARAEAIETAMALAESATNGYMLNEAGQREMAAGRLTERTLFTGRADWARKYASAELLAHWESHPRPTEAMHAGLDARLGNEGRRARRPVSERAAWRDAQEEASYDRMGKHAAGPVRPVASEGQSSARVRQDSRGDDVPGLAAGRIAAHVRQAAGADRRPGGPVQRGGRGVKAFCEHFGRHPDNRCEDCPLRRSGTVTTGSSAAGQVAALNARAAEIRARTALRATQAAPVASGTLSPAPAPVRPAGSDVAVREGGTVTRAAADRAAVIAAESIRYAERVLTRHVAWPTPQALDTVMLWILHANARDRDDAGYGPLIWRASPRLLLTSRDRGSGKSTGLDLIGMLTANSGRPSKITPRSIAHKLSNKHETVTLDEAKLMFGSGNASRELQGVLLTGYTRRGTYSYSSGGKDVDLKTFGAVAYAGKDELITDTSGLLGDLLDRSIVIRMRRAGRHYPDIDDAADDAAELAARGMATWATIMQGELTAASARLSREASEAGRLTSSDIEAGQLRVTQIWRPLLAVADVLGGDWPDRARAAAVAGDAETEEWLADLHALDAALYADADDYEDDEEF